MKIISNKSGFTIVELLISSAIFSMVLLITTFAVIQVSRVYYKGVISSQTQEVARSAIDEISRNIQFSGGEIRLDGSGPPSDYFCIGNKRYSYVVDQKVEGNKHALVVDEDTACTKGQNLNGGLSASSKELLAPNMRLVRLELSKPPAGAPDGVYELNLSVAYGDDDVLLPGFAGCPSVNLGGQFCAISHLSTTVQKRVK